MAHIVHSQGAMVQEINEAAESSHERASAGLEHLNKAASNQQQCHIS